MLRLAIRLAARSGREALVRLAVITAAVAIGVGLLLSVLAVYQGYQASVAKACWQCTNPDPGATSGSLLWNYRQDTYQGHDRRPARRGHADTRSAGGSGPVHDAHGPASTTPRRRSRTCWPPCRPTNSATGTRARSPAPSPRPVCRARTRSRSSSGMHPTRCAPYPPPVTSPPSTRRHTGCRRRSSTGSGSRSARSRCWYPWPYSSAPQPGWPRVGARNATPRCAWSAQPPGRST